LSNSEHRRACICASGHMKAFTSAAFVAVASAADFKLTWSDCGDSTTHMKIASFTPSALTFDQITTMTATGHLHEDVSGATFDLEMDSYGGQIACRGDASVPKACGEETGTGPAYIGWHGMDFPVKAGETSVNLRVQLGSALRYHRSTTTNVRLTSKNGDKLLCMQIKSSTGEGTSGVALPIDSKPKRRAAVIIDVTNEQYVKNAGHPGGDVYNYESVLANIERLVGGGHDAPRWDAIFDCRNWIYDPEDSAFGNRWSGGKPHTKGAQLVPPLAALKKAADNTSTSWRFIGKPTFSCLYDTTMDHALRALGIDELYVMGINTEQCVFATVFDAWRSRAVGEVFLVSDATSSGFGEVGHRKGIDMIHTVLCNEDSNCAAVINSSDIPRHAVGALLV
jgi:nicotinamidase-related amidase